MTWLRRLLSKWPARGQGQVRRVVLLVLDRLEPGVIDHYLEQGLLHNLALLSDVGTRSTWCESGPLSLDAFSAALAKHGMRIRMLPAALAAAPLGLDAICALDREQQERLIAELGRMRSEVVVGEFDMPAKLERLFGTDPDDNQRFIIRDVYARMDEIVGKAYSFVDERTALLVAIQKTEAGRAHSNTSAAGLLFASCPSEQLGPPDVSISSAVLRILSVDPSGT